MSKRALACFIIGALSGCTRSATPTQVPQEIFVPVGASKIESKAQKSGQVEVTYVIRERHPADRTHDGFARTLTRNGYHLLDHDFLDRNRRLSIPRTWAFYIDGRTHSQTCVRELIEDWQSTSGRIVRYGLSYRCVCDGSSDIAPESVTDELAVQAILLPANLAGRMEEAAKKQFGQQQ